MRLLYAGVDTLDFAVKGAIAKADLERLQTAKELAAAWQSPVLTEIGPGRLAVHVSEHGRKGGYAFVINTGLLGANYAIKDNDDAQQWNLFVSIRAGTLAAYGYLGARKLVLEELCAMGCLSIEVSVARVDYAMDFLAPDFVLDIERFVAHPHAKINPHYSEKAMLDDMHPHAIFRGRTVESVTIGKMPGRQIIVYDKRRAAIQKRELFWFEIWGVNRDDANCRVWRVEVRAGKRELKERWQLRTFNQLDIHLGDLIQNILSSIRYLRRQQTDSNVSRQRLDPLWTAALSASAHGLRDSINGIAPSRLRQLEREKLQAIYRQQILGNVAGLAVAMNFQDGSLESDLPESVGHLIRSQLLRAKSPLRRSINRARERLHFTTEEI